MWNIHVFWIQSGGLLGGNGGDLRHEVRSGGSRVSPTMSRAGRTALRSIKIQKWEQSGIESWRAYVATLCELMNGPCAPEIAAKHTFCVNSLGTAGIRRVSLGLK